MHNSLRLFGTCLKQTLFPSKKTEAILHQIQAAVSKHEFASARVLYQEIPAEEKSLKVVQGCRAEIEQNEQTAIYLKSLKESMSSKP